MSANAGQNAAEHAGQIIGKKAGRVGDSHVCPAVGGLMPHTGGPMVAASPAPVAVLAEGRPALRLGDLGACAGPPDVAVEGAANVLVGGLPWVGRFHRTVHGGMLVTGASAIVIGGPTFALPPLVEIRGPAWFQNQVVRDLFALHPTASGRQMWARIGAAGHPITIIPESDPHNSFATTSDPEAAEAGRPTGAIVKYNPAIAAFVFGEHDRQISFPPQIALAHEMMHALAHAEGHHYGERDPQPPESESDMQEDEASAIGVGSHEGDPLSENSFRKDLGLPRRENHYGVEASETTGNLRPGGY